jgi:hypothetical protein
MPDPTIIVPAPEVPAAPAAPAQAPAQAAPAAAPAAAAPVAAPASAPAAAPAQDPPVSFDPPAPAAPTTPQDARIVYEKTGDAGLDVALAYVGERGFGPDHPAIQAAMKGEFGELEKALGALGDKAKGHKEFVALAKESYGRRQAAEKAQSEAVAKSVYDTVGGKEQWAAIQAWASQHADDAEKAQLNAAFKAGGVAATAAAKYLADLFAKHGKTAPKAAVKPDASGAPAANTALSPRDYAKAVRELHAKLGSRMDTSPEYAQLQSRRAAYRG